MVALDDLDSLRGGNSFIHIVLKSPLCMNIYWYLIDILATEFFICKITCLIKNQTS